jgi:hypothetical protein
LKTRFGGADRFIRMWEYYLAEFEASFRSYGLAVFQIQLIKNVDAAPLTRGYMYENKEPPAPGGSPSASAGPSTSSPGGPCVGTSSSRTGSTCGGDGSALIVTGLGPPGRDGAATICTTRPGTCCTPPRACSSSCRNTVCRSRALAGSDCCHECRRVHENLPLVRRFGVPAYSCG